MTYIATLYSFLACCLMAALPWQLNPEGASSPTPQPLSLDAKLDKKVERFEAANRTVIASLIDLAYEHGIPMGIEYVDREAATRRIGLQLSGESVRGILTAIIHQAPEYRIDFSSQIVTVYSPMARRNPSNLLNRVVKNFSITEEETHDADQYLFCALVRDVEARNCISNIASGQWGNLKVSVHMQNSSVHEILNAIVAQNGKALWIPTAPPEKLSKIPPVGGLWYIYPLDPAFKRAVLATAADVAAQAPAGGASSHLGGDGLLAGR